MLVGLSLPSGGQTVVERRRDHIDPLSRVCYLFLAFFTSLIRVTSTVLRAFGRSIPIEGETADNLHDRLTRSGQDCPSVTVKPNFL